MIVLKCNAPKANGLSSGAFFYIANEYVETGGRLIATITKDIKRAMKFPDEHTADQFNEKMMAFGNFSKPFQKQKI